MIEMVPNWNIFHLDFHLRIHPGSLRKKIRGQEPAGLVALKWLRPICLIPLGLLNSSRNPPVLPTPKQVPPTHVGRFAVKLFQLQIKLLTPKNKSACLFWKDKKPHTFEVGTPQLLNLFLIDEIAWTKMVIQWRDPTPTGQGHYSLPETNNSHLAGGPLQTKRIFRPCCFRCELLVSRR